MYPVESESGASCSPYDDGDDVTIFTVMLPSVLQSNVKAWPAEGLACDDDHDSLCTDIPTELAGM